MRIVLTFEYPFASTGYGGGHQIVRGLGRALVRAGHDVHVVCTGTDELGVQTQDAGVRYHFAGKFDSRISGFQTARIAIPLLRSIRPDLVCSFTSEAPFVVPVARLLKARATVYLAAPTLRSFGRLTRDLPRDVRRDWGQFLQSLGSRLAERVFAISDALAEQACDGWRIDRHRLVTIGAGIDEAMLERPDLGVADLPSAGARLISVGRITFPQKPLQLMAAALALVPDLWTHWTIVGSGPDEGALRQILRKLALEDRVILVGMQPSHEVARLLDESHLAILPSTNESFFITVYEAAARGCVIVTNRVAEVEKNLSHNESVVLAESTSPEDYRRAIESALQSYSQRAQAAKRLAGVVRSKLSWDAVAARLLQAADAPTARR